MLPPPLVALSPGDLDASAIDAFLARVDAAFAGGVRGILFRERRLDDRDWGRAFTRLRERAEGWGGTWIGAHDRVHLALAGGADAVHLGFRSLPPPAARKLLPSTMSLGLSTHAGDDPALWGEADYLFHGPVRATPSKEGRQEPIGTAGLARATAMSPRPVLAIGGLGPEDAGPVLAAGARGLAVLSGILGREDPAGAARRYLAALEAAAGGRR